MTAALRMEHELDPRQIILDATKAEVEKLQPLGARVLIGTYIRPDRTKSGIYLSDKTRDEDSYQGRVGLVLKMGPLAFVEDEEHKWGDIRPKVGDWIVCSIGDARRMQLGKSPTRFVEDVHVQAIVTDPDIAW